MNLPNTNNKINVMNTYNIIKINEEYQEKLRLFKRIKEKYESVNNKDNPIYNEEFEDNITTV